MYQKCYCNTCESEYNPTRDTFQFDGTDIGICSECIDSIDKIELIEMVASYIKDMYVLTPSRYRE